jgi:GAF domain-containing protein
MPQRSTRTYFKTLLEEAGVFEALRFVNSKSAHRFTALYAFDGPLLRNVCLVDKENNSVRRMDSCNVTDSYCLYVRNSNQKFVMPDSLSDERVAEHPKREVIQSYCGMPLINEQSTLLGTICHFDFSPIPYTDEEVDILEMIAPDLVHELEKST